MENKDPKQLEININEDFSGILGGIGFLLSPYFVYRLYKNFKAYQKYDANSKDLKLLSKSEKEGSSPK